MGGGAPPDVSDGDGRAAEDLLEAGLIDAEEYRRRIADSAPPMAPAARKGQLASARSQGSVAAAPRPASRRATFSADAVAPSPASGAVALVPPPEMREMGLAAKGRAMTFDEHEREVSSLRHAHAQLSEQLDAKEMVLQEMIGQLSEANSRLRHLQSLGPPPAAAPARSASRP